MPPVPGPPREVSRRAKRAVKTEVRCTFRADSKTHTADVAAKSPYLGTRRASRAFRN